MFATTPIRERIVKIHIIYHLLIVALNRRVENVPVSLEMGNPFGIGENLKYEVPDVGRKSFLSEILGLELKTGKLESSNISVGGKSTSDV